MTATVTTGDPRRQGRAAKTSGPVLLRPDNFVPLARTPWGGAVIGRRYKGDLVPESRDRAIGESWEFSCDPAFPSRLVDGGETLAVFAARERTAVFSAAWRGAPTIDFMVKLLDAAEPLSLQVHPADDDPGLAAGECGKPESWLVLAAAKDAGIYLGFAAPLAKSALREALHDGDRVSELLHFEPVRPGDYFEIAPGVPHAIGPGVTVLEPQRVLAGKAGKTFRMWDWGRRYDDTGVPDPAGRPRELHLEQCLALVDPERQAGAALAAEVRRAPAVTDLGGLRARVFPPNAYYRTALFAVAKGTSMSLDVEGGYAAALVLAGTFRAAGVRLGTGQPALLPHAAMPLAFYAEENGELAVVTPAACRVSFRP